MNYLTTSDILAITALIAIESGAVGIRWRFAFFVVTLVALFFLGSRATIVIFIICLMCSPGPGTSLGKRVGLSLVICAISLVGFYFTINYAGEELSYRLISLMEMDGDGSRVTRAMFQDRFISRLGDEPLCLIYPCFPQEGEYAHNILSVQQYFGVVGSALIGGLFINFVMTRLRGARTPLVATMMFCLLMMLLARAWLSLVFPILSAYLLSAILSRNIRSES
ncbi:hypothetical protein UB46_29125 [Burkholderiaceae bacterium 16]|nr:hypothetical protein UB46_29125 [Burkholderiaceae bacterium 16]